MPIKPISDMSRYKLTRWHTRKIDQGSESMEIRTFLRFTGLGLVAVTCYLPSDLNSLASTLVEMCHEGYEYRRWYQNVVVTDRGAAHMVNRFLEDWNEFQEKVKVQP